MNAALRCIAAVAMILLAASSATAQTSTTTMPPPKFDVPFRGALTIWRTERVEQNGKLMAVYIFANGKFNKDSGWKNVAFSNRPAVGLRPSDKCEIFIVKDEVLKARGWSKALVLRHELAHCNGWPGTHPGGKKVPISLRLAMPELPPGTRWLTTTFLN